MCLWRIPKMICWFLLSLTMCLLFIVTYCEAAGTQKQSNKNKKRAPNTIEAEGYTYSFEPDYRGYPGGKYIIKNIKREIFYSEETGLESKGCGNFPTISKVPFGKRDHLLLGGAEKTKWLVITCGSISGRHLTLKIFLHGNPGLFIRTTSIHLEDTTPNLKDIDGDGLLETEVYRRVLFEGIGSGTAKYLTIYKLIIDDSIFGFTPSFGSSLAEKYFDYYQYLITGYKTQFPDDFFDLLQRGPMVLGPMLAALLSTQDKKMICRGIKTLIQNKVSLNDLQTWKERVKTLGYPDFDFNICKEVD